MKIPKARLVQEGSRRFIALYSQLTLWKNVHASEHLYSHWSFTLPCGYYSESWAEIAFHLFREHSIEISRAEIEEMVADRITEHRSSRRLCEFDSRN